MNARQEALALIALLLQYPDEALSAGRDEFTATARNLPADATRAALLDFLDWYGEQPPFELAQHYVETFDLRRRTSLYLTYYLHGDTRRRGMAMLVLKQRYRAAGLAPPEDELPDYLPVVCEFAALLGPGAGEAPLRQHRTGLELIRAGLHDAGSPYALLLGALTTLMGELSEADRAAVLALAADGPPDEEVGLAPFAPPDYLTGTEIRA
ncbi:nitrate reductase molybdenum cofactor assembly chaperone [Saccharothrix sp. NRRL B-16314]|uniref:nitrate reductase molybdenum cofactor assembly chaperone n=1 Tax=Saccharothrix sp. NRRL B-16314 TaxID=1463825 RepID=UPI0009E020A5|nr:nitrate reductase molybdenum cofactor assembly chaperone [Saccharothrix sp. NRRL B-16314]